MRTLFSASALLLLTATAASAQLHSHQLRVARHDFASRAELVSRVAPADARHVITTNDQGTSLLLTQDHLIIQLTNRGLREIRGDLRGESGRFGPESHLDRGIAYPLAEIGDVRYVRNRLVVTDREGASIFREGGIEGTDPMADFTASEARAFAREFRRVKAER